MAMKCPSCGGFVTYNIDNRTLDCAYCGNSVFLDEYKEKNACSFDASENGDTGTLENREYYLCKDCGAELSAPKEQTVAYCMYCGGQNTLLQKGDVVERPTSIVPFKWSKTALKSQYLQYVEKKPFVPKDFKKEEFLDEFRGIYIPYWLTSVSVPYQNFTFDGFKSFTEGNYNVTQTYKISTEVEGEIDGGCYDASAAFDDTIATEIAPFMQEDCEPFDEAFLAGFYSDKPTTPVETYKPFVDETAVETVSKDISEWTEGVEVTEKSIERNLQRSDGSVKTALFPVWFLTWRKGKRVAYGAMNGATGKMTIDLPVDYKKFFLLAIVFTLILFGFFSLFNHFIQPLSIAGFSSVFLYFSSGLLKNELEQIKIRENHIYDWGDKDHKMRKIKPGAKKVETVLLGFWKLIAFFLLLTAFYKGFFAESTDDLSAGLFLMIILQTVMLIRQISRLKHIKSKYALFTIILSEIIQIAGFIITDSSRQHDFWYVGIAIACLCGLISNMITSIFYMNYLTTRPVPNFYTRKGADNGTK